MQIFGMKIGDISVRKNKKNLMLFSDFSFLEIIGS